MLHHTWMRLDLDASSQLIYFHFREGESSFKTLDRDGQVFPRGSPVGFGASPKAVFLL
jgi:hypothetical protein